MAPRFTAAGASRSDDGDSRGRWGAAVIRERHSSLRFVYRSGGLRAPPVWPGRWGARQIVTARAIRPAWGMGFVARLIVFYALGCLFGLSANEWQAVERRGVSRPLYGPRT